MADFDVVLTTHNRLELTINCVNALYENTQLPFNLIVIDDSEDLTPQWFKSFSLSHDNVNYIRPKETIKNGNHGWKIGLEHVTSEYVVYLVNSTTVEPNWLDVAFPTLKKNQPIGLVGFKLLYPNGLIWHAGIGFQNNLPFHIGFNEPGHHHTYIQEVAAVNPSVGLFRRNALLNSLDDETYIGWRGFEDTDMCLSLRQNGWRILYCGFGCAYHIESPTRLVDNPDQQKFWEEYIENRRRFLVKWQSKLERGII